MILTDEEIEALGHRIAWRYKKSSDPHHSDTYTFNRSCLMHFADAIEREVLRKLRERPANGLLVETDGGPMYWPAEEVEEARLYCDIGEEPTRLNIIPTEAPVDPVYPAGYPKPTGGGEG